MTAFLILLLAQAPTVDERVGSFVKGDAAARAELLKLGAAAIRSLQGARDKAPEKIDALVHELKVAVAFPKDSRAIEALSAKISTDFVNMPYRDATDYLREICEVQFFFDRIDEKDLPAREVTVKLSDVPARDALNLICRQTGLDYGYFHNAVVIGKAERLWPAGKTAPAFGPAAAERQDPKTPGGIAVMRQLRTIKMDLDFQNQTLSDMATYIKEFTGLAIDLRGDADAAKFTVRLRGALLIDALSLITQARGLDFMIDEPMLVIDTREKLAGTK